MKDLYRRVADARKALHVLKGTNCGGIYKKKMNTARKRSGRYYGIR